MELPGTIYKRGKRWWWAVKLPGQKKRQSLPLAPVGSRLATTDLQTAHAVAASLWAQAMAAGEARETAKVSDLVPPYLAHIDASYPAGSKEPPRVRTILAVLTMVYPRLPALEFSPLKLETVRAEMAKTLSRKECNRRVRVIIRMFRWAVAREYVPSSVWQALLSVEGIKRGQAVETDGGMVVPKDHPPVRPARPEWVEATAQYATKVLSAMMRVQLLTGMRSGEMVRLRARDIEMDGAVWAYHPASIDGGAEHKTAHHGAARVVQIGPKAQAILKPFLKRKGFLFSAKAALDERNVVLREMRKTPVQPSQLDRSKPVGRRVRARREFFTTDTYRQAVELAIKRANRIRAKTGLEPIPHWHPHQLRHTAATLARKAEGRDAARAMLGQRTLGMADLYAEIDEGLAVKVAEGIG